MPSRFDYNEKKVNSLNFYKISYTVSPRKILAKKTDGIDLFKVLLAELSARLPHDRIIRLEQGYNTLDLLVCTPSATSESALDTINDAIAQEKDTGDITMSLCELSLAEALSEKQLDDDAKAYLTALSNGETPPPATKTPTAEASPDTSAKAATIEKEDPFKKVESLVAMEELKAWAKEQKLLAEKTTNKTLLSQTLLGLSYLVSVNPGNGCTTMLQSMGDVLAHVLGKSKAALSEFTVSPDTEAKDYNVDKICKEISFRDSKGETLQVVALHVDKLQNNMHITAWRALLDQIWESRRNAIFIFVLPYLENSVLFEMHKKIEDVLPNKLLTEKPLSNPDYLRFFELYFKKFEMTLSEEAKLSLPKKLAEEKSDGRFYGINTIHKICDEILYSKLKRAATSDSESLSVVSDADIQSVMLLPALTGEKSKSGIEQLDALVSLQNVKTLIKEILATVKMQRHMNAGHHNSMHMMFSGAPGTGKTVVARILGEILREEGILSVGGFYEVTRKDLVGQYIGHTAPKTAEICQAAYGSVLFIDEAYMLDGGGQNDYGKEAISTLIAEMENKRDDFVVIFAGYEKELEQLLQLNPGLRDRIPYKVPFVSYNRAELEQIFYKMLPDKFGYNDEFKAEAHSFFENLSDAIMQNPNFSNARFVRNLVERVISKAALRMQMQQEYEAVPQLVKSDFTLAAADAEFKQLNAKKASSNRIGFTI